MTGSGREREIARFLAGAGWGGAAVAPLAADASFRRYLRVRRGAETAVLMDAPPEREPIAPYAAIARHLRVLGFAAPDIAAADEAAGLLLMEDLGDHTFTRLLEGGADEAALYELAIDTLVALHRLDPAAAIPPGLARYSDDLLLAEAHHLLDWYLPTVGVTVGPARRTAYGERWRAAFARARQVPETLVLRDFHVDNLMRLGGRDGVAACGLVDFQDAVAGPASYDFVSLVEDARRDVPPALARSLRDRYLAAFPGLDADAFERSCAILGAQRHCKVIGIFTRLSRRDGKDGYLGHIARVWRLLEAAVAHPALGAMRDWLDDAVPARARAVPGPEAAA
ncbi:MAG: phosphotransferase [Defluviicoccus sp.]|nr:phosphotransferase [Defluviicoccus sp.]